jgi:hypothetical protein
MGLGRSLPLGSSKQASGCNSMFSRASKVPHPTFFFFFFLLRSNQNSLKVQRHNPSTQEVYKRFYIPNQKKKKESGKAYFATTKSKTIFFLYSFSFLLELVIKEERK